MNLTMLIDSTTNTPIGYWDDQVKKVFVLNHGYLVHKVPTTSSDQKQSYKFVDRAKYDSSVLPISSRQGKDVSSTTATNDGRTLVKIPRCKTDATKGIVTRFNCVKEESGRSSDGQSSSSSSGDLTDEDEDDYKLNGDHINSSEGLSCTICDIKIKVKKD